MVVPVSVMAETEVPEMPCWVDPVIERLLMVMVLTLFKNRLDVHVVVSPATRLLPQEAAEDPCVVALLVRFMFLSVMFFTLTKLMPLLVLFWIVPPLPAVVPTPVTVKLPALVQTVFSTIPLVPPL